MSEQDTYANAQLIVIEIREALARGTRHYALDGTPLLTVEAILEALLRDGEIAFQPVDPEQGCR